MCGLFYVLLVISICGLPVTECNYDEDSWVEPNAWSREAPGLRLSNDLSTCPVCSELAINTEDGVALIYYKKFIATLFKRDILQYNEATKVYQRSLLFSIQPAQLEKLEKLNDPRDLDMVLTEIIATARTLNASNKKFNKSMGFIELIFDIVKDFGQLLKIFTDTIKDILYLLKISEVRFTLFVLLAILLCWFVHHRYKIGYVWIILIGVIAFGYFITYLECNRKLEMDEMIELMRDGEESWFSSVVGYFKKPNKNQEQIDMLRKSSKIRLRFCRPDHVFIMYVNDLVLKQLETLIETGSALIYKFTDLPFPLNFLSPFVFFLLVGWLLKLIFKYILSPKAWASLFYYRKTFSHAPKTQTQNGLPTSGAESINEDRISGENLKLFLNAMKRPHVVVTGGNVSLHSASGVEEVLEKITFKEKIEQDDKNATKESENFLNESKDIVDK